MQLSKGLLLTAIFAAVAGAVPVTIGDTTLDNITSGASSFTYSGLDGSGTALTVSRVGGSFDPLVGGTWPGLWFGSSNTTGTYTLTFNTPVQFIEIYVTAASTSPTGGFSETFNNFSTNVATTPSFTNVVAASFNAGVVTGTQDDYRFRIRFTASGSGLTSLTFSDVQVGNPNGSVIQEVIYDRATSSSTTPEPSTFGFAAVGLTALGAAYRKRKQLN